MKKRNKVIIAIVTVLVFVVAVFALTRNSTPEAVNTDNASSTSTSSETDNSATTTDTNPATSTDATPASEVIITYSNSGFGPASIKVKSGDIITLKNASSSTVELSSDPHPTHTSNSELNLGELAPGSSKTFKVTKTGTWGYHNHLNQTETGSVVVE